MSRKFIIENFDGEHPFLYAPYKEKTDKITKSKYPPERIEIDFEPTNEIDGDWEDKELHDQIKTTVSTLTEKPMRFSDELFYVLHTKIPPSDPNIGTILDRLGADIVSYLDSKRQSFIVKGLEKKLDNYAKKARLPKLFLENILVLRPLDKSDQLSQKLFHETNDNFSIISIMPNLTDDSLENYSKMIQEFLSKNNTEFYEIKNEGIFLSKIPTEKIVQLLHESMFVHFVEPAPKGIVNVIKRKQHKQKPKAIVSGIEPLTKQQELPLVVVMDSGINDIQQLQPYIHSRDSYKFDSLDDLTGASGHGTPVSSLLVLGEKLNIPKSRIVSYKIFETPDNSQPFLGMMEGIVKYNQDSRFFLSSINFDDLNPKLEAKLDRLIQKNNICFVNSAGNILPEEIENELRTIPYPRYISKYNVQSPSTLVSVISVGSIATKFENKNGVKSIAELNQLAPYSRCNTDNVFLFDCHKPEILDSGANLNVEKNQINFENVGLDSFNRSGNVESFAGTSFSAPLFMRKLVEIETFYGSAIKNSETLKAISFISTNSISSECSGHGIARKILGCDNNHALYFSEGKVKIRGESTTEFYEKPYAEISIDVPFSVNRIDLCLVHSDDFQLSNIPYLNTILNVDVWKTASGSKVKPDNIEELDKITNVKFLTYSFKQRSMEGKWRFKIYPKLTSKMPAKYRNELEVRFGVVFLLSRKPSLKQKPMSMNKEISMIKSQ